MKFVENYGKNTVVVEIFDQLSFLDIIFLDLVCKIDGKLPKAVITGPLVIIQPFPFYYEKFPHLEVI